MVRSRHSHLALFGVLVGLIALAGVCHAFGGLNLRQQFPRRGVDYIDVTPSYVAIDEDDEDANLDLQTSTSAALARRDIASSIITEATAIRRAKKYAQDMMACPGVKSPGFMIAGVRGDTALFAESIGKASVLPNINANANTLWAIGSCTKSVTGLLIGKEVDKGTLTWNTPIASVLPGFSTNNSVADTSTVRDLLAMQMGIPRNDIAWFIGAAGNMTRNVQNFHVLPAASPLRQTFWYNSFGFSFLGRIKELLTNKTWSEAIKTEIFAPLGMTNSVPTLNDAYNSGRFAYPHVLNAATQSAVNSLPFNLNAYTVDQVAAAGSIAMTANDATKYLSALLSPTFKGYLTTSSYDFLHKRGIMSLSGHDGSTDEVINFFNDPYSPIQFQFFSYGGGWMHGLYKNRNIIAHNGGTLGHSSWIFVFPEDNLAFAFVANMDGLSSMGHYMFDWAIYARDQFMNDRKDSVSTATICDRFNAKTGGPALAYVDNSYIVDYLLTANFSSSYLNSITGVYANAFYQTMNITMAPGGNTVAFQSGNLNGTLMTGPYTGNAFFSSPYFYQVQALGTGFANFDPVTGKAGTLNMGLDTIDPVFVRVN
jgi:CubicO group peptidase (beta-lactamase class C family)